MYGSAWKRSTTSPRTRSQPPASAPANTSPIATASPWVSSWSNAISSAWASVCPRLSVARSPVRSCGSRATTSALIAAQRATTSASSAGSRASIAARAHAQEVDEPGRVVGDVEHQRVLRDLAEPAVVVALGDRRERVGVGDDADRLVERADEVLALGQVDRGLAADRGVDHRRAASSAPAAPRRPGGRRRPRSRRCRPPPRRRARPRRRRAAGPSGRSRGRARRRSPSVLCASPSPMRKSSVGASIPARSRVGVAVGDRGLAHDRDPPAAGEQRAGVGRARPTSTTTS